MSRSATHKMASSSCLLVFTCLLALRSVVCLDGQFQYLESSFKASGQPEDVTVPAKTLVYSCDYRSSAKMKYLVNSNYPVYSYSVAQSDLKDVKVIDGRVAFSFERRSACFNRTICDSYSNGRILAYVKCFVLNNAAGDQDVQVSLKLKAKWDEQILAIYVLMAAVGLAVLAVLAFVVCRIFQCCGDCDCMRDVWHANGKAARKSGYSQYQAAVV